MKKVIKDAQAGTLKSQPGKTMIESFEYFVNTELNTARDKAGQIALDALS